MKIFISSTEGSFFFDDLDVSLAEILLCWEEQIIEGMVREASGRR